MEQNKERKRKKRISSGLVVGLIALTINIITVSVYVYQANIMQTQQFASVWPYLEWRTGYTQNDGFRLQVKNNGVGPALIKNTKMTLDGEEITELDTLFQRLIGTTMFPHVTSDIENRVLPAGESIKIIGSEHPKWSELLYYELKKRDFKFEICFESIYEEQWICKGVEVVKSSCK